MFFFPFVIRYSLQFLFVVLYVFSKFLLCILVLYYKHAWGMDQVCLFVFLSFLADRPFGVKFVSIDPEKGQSILAPTTFLHIRIS